MAGRAVGHVSFKLDGAPLSDPHWPGSLRRFFVAFALKSNNFLASVKLLRNHERVSRSYERRDRAEEKIWPIHGGEGKWLVPSPQSWTWFDPDQIDIVSPILTGRREAHSDCLFHVFAEEPVVREHLTALLPDPSQPWIPRVHPTPCTS